MNEPKKLVNPNPFLRRIRHPNEYSPPEADSKAVNQALWGTDEPPRDIKVNVPRPRK